MDKRFPIGDQIEVFSSALRGRVIAPQHSDYDSMRAVMLGNFDHRPAAVIRVANAADVAAAINFAQATGLELAVRSGGHSTIGKSGCTGGLVIDLRDLNGIEIDAEARTAWCGTGLTAGDVLLRLRGIVVVPNDSSSGIKPTFPTEHVKVDNAVMPEVDVTYMATDNIGLELIASTTRHNASAAPARPAGSASSPRLGCCRRR